MQNPMGFFNQKNGFPFQAMPQSQFSPENLLELKKMVKQYHSILNDDFWSNIHGLGTSKRKEIQLIPVEIWESEHNIYLLIICPGLKELNHAKVFFQNDQVLTLKIKHQSVKPAGADTLLSSDLPQTTYEREIFLPKSVMTSNYSSSYEDGILTYVLKKAEDHESDLEIPFDF